MCSLHVPDKEDRPPPCPGEECVELTLLMPSWVCAALERAAIGRGLTIGQLVRGLIATHLAARDDG